MRSSVLPRVGIAVLAGMVAVGGGAAWAATASSPPSSPRARAGTTIARTVATRSAASARSAGTKPRVAVIGTGGTIAGVADSRVGFESYQPGKLPIGRLVGDLQPEVGRLGTISTYDFGTAGSGAYTLADYAKLSQLVDANLRRADAVVVTSGSADLEELAYFLDLTVRSAKPVVVTGAMRPWNVIGADGPANLYNAIRLAASGRTTCFGTTVLVNDQIFPARDVTKTDTLRLNAFATREFGDLGTVDEKGIRIERAPARVRDCPTPSRWRTPFDLGTLDGKPLPRVEIVDAYVDAGPEPITALTDAGVRGLVFAGTPSPRQFDAARTAAERGVTLVAANGYGAGAVHVDPGLGVLSAGDLSGRKARILLTLALANTSDPSTLAAWFQAYGSEEF